VARLLYTLLFYCLTPFIFLRLLLRSRKAPAYRLRWGERLGFVPRLDAEQVIWVHSVSVGETLAAVPMIKLLQQRNPQAQLVVTTMTPTGSERVKASFGGSVYHVYAPYDMPDAVSRFIRRVKPDKLIIMETELWPNLIAGCHKYNVPVLVANARLSAKSAIGYGKVAALTRSIFSHLTCVAAQTVEDGERFKQLGLCADKLQVTGNIKFDLDLDQAVQDKAAQLRQEWQGEDSRPIFLVASTHRGEDAFLLAAHQQILLTHPDLLLVLVPRHPERFNEIAELCRSQGFSIVRRSLGQIPKSSDQILLGDSMGELLAF
jgi:3-deoxy-D-manno-octulosonic-acid transferase